jgi:hypothetical protein
MKRDLKRIVATGVAVMALLGGTLITAPPASANVIVLGYTDRSLFHNGLEYRVRLQLALDNEGPVNFMFARFLFDGSLTINESNQAQDIAIDSVKLWENNIKVEVCDQTNDQAGSTDGAGCNYGNFSHSQPTGPCDGFRNIGYHNQASGSLGCTGASHPDKSQSDKNIDDVGTDLWCGTVRYRVRWQDAATTDWIDVQVCVGQ